MTVIALVVRGDVIKGLSGRLDAVMTRYTAACDGRVIHECDNGPVCRDVTVRTFPCCQYVTGRFRRCPDESAVGVTVGTGGICRTEGSTDMTALTGDVRMCAVKNETGAEMVERFLRRGVCLK